MNTSGFFNTPSLGDSYTNFTPIETSKTGFNELYKVERGGRYFIVKALRKEFRGNPLYESLLKKEAEIGFSLDNTHICRTNSLEGFNGIGNGIVLEYIDGRTLSDYIKEAGHSTKELYRIISQLCEALSYAHKKQVIHRDIKPENIIITFNGDNVKLIDFGLSDTDSHSTLKEPAGSRKYASPEQLRGDSLNNRSDIYSLGVVIDQIFQPRPSTKINKIVSKCCRYSPNERFHNCEQLNQAINSSNWVRYASVAAALIFITITSVIVINTMQISEIPDPVLNQDEIDNMDKYYDMAAIYYERGAKWLESNMLTSDPFAEIPDFKADSLKFIENDRRVLDSIFSDKKTRQSNYYKTLSTQETSGSYFKLYHENYVSSFFDSAWNIFIDATDSKAKELRKAAPKEYEYDRNLYGKEREEAETRYLNSIYEIHNATVLPYIIFKREEKGLSPLPEEFMTFYTRKVKTL